MNRRAILAVMATVSSALVACGSDTEVNLGSRPQFSNGTSALTVLVYDGTTGNAMTGAALTLRVGPELITAETEANSNAYTFTNVPSETVLPIFATAAGYLDFAGETDELDGGTLAAPAYSTATMVMFPATGVGHDARVTVVEAVNGAAVTGGTVLLTMGEPAAVFATTLTNAINGTYGFKPSILSYPLSGGIAVIPAASFIYGATYSVSVIGASATGLQLEQVVGPLGLPQFNPVTDYPDQVIMMKVMGDEAKPVVLSADNENGGEHDKLTIKFAQLVDVTQCNVDKVDFVASAFGGTLDDDGDPDVNGRLTPSDANGATTLVIEPLWTTAPTGSQTSVGVTFENVEVRLRNTDTCVRLKDLCLRTQSDDCADNTFNMTINYTLP